MPPRAGLSSRNFFIRNSLRLTRHRRARRFLQTSPDVPGCSLAGQSMNEGALRGCVGHRALPRHASCPVAGNAGCRCHGSHRVTSLRFAGHRMGRRGRAGRVSCRGRVWPRAGRVSRWACGRLPACWGWVLGGWPGWAGGGGPNESVKFGAAAEGAPELELFGSVGRQR